MWGKRGTLKPRRNRHRPCTWRDRRRFRRGSKGGKPKSQAILRYSRNPESRHSKVSLSKQANTAPAESCHGIRKTGLQFVLEKPAQNTTQIGSFSFSCKIVIPGVSDLKTSGRVDKEPSSIKRQRTNTRTICRCSGRKRSKQAF